MVYSVMRTLLGRAQPFRVTNHLRVPAESFWQPLRAISREYTFVPVAATVASKNTVAAGNALLMWMLVHAGMGMLLCEAMFQLFE